MAACPYCSVELEHEPEDESPCPACGNTIYVRREQPFFTSPLLTADAVKDIELWNWLLEQAKNDDTGKIGQRLRDVVSEILGGKSGLRSGLGYLLVACLLEIQEPCRLAQYLRDYDGSQEDELKEYHRLTLLRYQAQGVKYIGIQQPDIRGDRHIPDCVPDMWDTVTIEEALANQSLPCSRCNFIDYETNTAVYPCKYIPLSEEEYNQRLDELMG